MGNYEAKVDRVQIQQVEDFRALMEFLDAHPDFRTFFDLFRKVRDLI